MAVIPYTDANIIYSPYVWEFQSVTAARAWHKGAYLKAYVVASSLSIDCSGDGGRIAYRVNGQAWTYATTGVVPVTFSPDVSWSVNLIEVAVSSETVRFNGFVVNDGAYTRPMKAMNLRGLVLGDSITLGNNTESGYGANGLVSWAFALRDYLGAEIGVHGQNSRGWLNSNGANSYALSVAWEVLKQAGNVPSDIPFDFTNPPDFVAIMCGGGDTDSGASAPALASAVTTTINDMLATLPPSTQIIVLRHTYDKPAVETIESAVLGMSDPRLHYIDTTGWVPLVDKPDNIHHIGAANWALMAPYAADAIRDALAGMAGSGTVGFYRCDSSGNAVPVYVASAP